MNTTDRINIPFTNEHFINWAIHMVGQPYSYGATILRASAELLNAKSKQYPSHYATSRLPRYRQDIENRAVVADCVGAVKGYMWTNGGQGVIEAIGTDKTFQNKYKSNGCPDLSANGMFDWAKKQDTEWGRIDTLPEIPGLALHKDGHVGYYIGDGWAVEWRGFSYGCVKTKVKDRPWTHWYKLPFILYPEMAESGEETTAENTTLGSRLLKKGLTGYDVKLLQEYLNQLGAALETDGEFGRKTEAAVIDFQKDAGITVDGLYGKQSHAALLEAVERLSTAVSQEATAEPANTEPAVEPSDTEPQTVESAATEGIAAPTVTIHAVDSFVNVRVGNGMEYSVITTVAPGTELEYIATASNGWHAVRIGEQVGWVSGEYSEVSVSSGS